MDWGGVGGWAEVGGVGEVGVGFGRQKDDGSDPPNWFSGWFGRQQEDGPIDALASKPPGGDLTHGQHALLAGLGKDLGQGDIDRGEGYLTPNRGICVSVSV